jgi:hypothetical protein
MFELSNGLSRRLAQLEARAVDSRGSQGWHLELLTDAELERLVLMAATVEVEGWTAEARALYEELRESIDRCRPCPD